MHESLYGAIRSYPVFVALAIAVGAVVSLRSAHLAGVALRSYLGLQMALVLAGVFGAKLYSIWERAWILQPMSWELTHGYRYPGGLIAVALLAVSLGPRLWRGGSIGQLADFASIGTAFAMATVRIGCLLAGCCFGTVCTLPWGLRFPQGSTPWKEQLSDGLILATAPQSLPVHPLPVYFLLLSLGTGILLLWLSRRRTYPGQVCLTYLAVHESGKGLLELLRYHFVWHLPVTSLAVGAVAGLALLIRVRFGIPALTVHPVLPENRGPATVTRSLQ